MTTFIFELSTPTFYKAVEYKSTKRTLKNIQSELDNWAHDNIKHFGLVENSSMSYAAHTYQVGQHLLAIN